MNRCREPPDSALFRYGKELTAKDAEDAKEITALGSADRCVDFNVVQP